MSNQSLENMLESTDPTDLLRGNEGGYPFPFPKEYTNWIEEQKAWRETSAFLDQSYHMADLYVQGPDALDLFSDLGVNSFENFEIGQAKQLVMCNSDGYLISEGILYYLDNKEFKVVGVPAAANWLSYNAETGDYDVEKERYGSLVEITGDPEYFRFQIQGPEALDVLKAVTEGSLPDISFFHFANITIDGYDIKGLRHGMAGEAGLEIWGPYEWGDEIKKKILEAGEDYGMKRIGSKSYESTALESGWMGGGIPAIYESDEMKEYREWLRATDYEAVNAIGGSLNSDDTTNYYLTPFDLGYDHIVAFDHDFLGRSALEEMANNPDRTKVTLVWDSEDLVDVYASLFKDGDTYKFVDLVAPRWAGAHYDRLLKDDQSVGVSKYPGYIYPEREFLSLATIDTELSEPGTEVTVVWGEEDSPKSTVENHVETEISATVAPVPYSKDNRSK